jgi:drug/metabolite transporter superfamily protein YnfA
MFDFSHFDANLKRRIFLCLFRWRIRVRYAGTIAKFWTATGGILVAGALLWHHVGTDAALPILADATPILLAIVGVVMSYIQPRRESHKATTIALFVAGLAGTGVLSYNRIRTERSHHAEVQGLGQKIESVGAQNTKLANFLLGSKGQISEADRRRGIETILRNEYILANNPIDPQILAGNQMPPQDWMNKRLAEMGENWKVAESQQHLPSHPPVPPPIKEVVITGIHATNLATAAGENTSVFVRLGVNANKALPIKMYQESAIKPFYGDDGLQQAKLEDDLWDNLLQSGKTQDISSPLQLSANNQDVGIPLTFKSVSTDQLNRINTEQSRYYFLCQLRKEDGSNILDVCFYLDKKGEISYCRSHNGP